MQLVIADTSPINYLLLIGHIDILPVLFGQVVLPETVKAELQHPKAPAVVRSWVAALPAWIEVRQVAQGIVPGAAPQLDPGEEAAIALAVELHADLLLMDDEAGIIVARRKGIEATGTLGILSRAAGSGLLNLSEAFDRIKRTNFRYRQETMDTLLEEQKGG